MTRNRGVCTIALMVPDCRFCGGTRGHRSHVVLEMMFGLREPFEYLECGTCGSLRIKTVPQDLERHYPSRYYAFSEDSHGALYRLARRARDRYAFSGRGILGRALASVRRRPPYLAWLRKLGITYESSILDVGCGGGVLVSSLADAGFTVTGIDAFIDAPKTLSNGRRILRQSLEQTVDRYDAVMLHHSLEHMRDPAAAFGHLRRLVNPGGTVLIRTPLVGQRAWRQYGVNWVGLDAPRHLYIPSRDGMLRLAAAHGFAVGDVVFDSTSSQFWASELYSLGIPLHGSSPASHFSRSELARFEAETRRANAEEDGDQACFYLRPA